MSNSKKTIQSFLDDYINTIASGVKSVISGEKMSGALSAISPKSASREEQDNAVLEDTNAQGNSEKPSQPYLDAYMNANPGMKDFVSGGKNTGGAVSFVLPEGASREEQDLASVYQTAYNNAIEIDKRAQNAVLEANKAHDLSMKYLAAQNEASGLSGLGIADTSALRLSSQYQKALTDAYATKEASLLENYQKMTEDANTIRGEWASREEAKAEEAKAEEETKYNNALNHMANITNEASLNAYLDATFGNDTAKKEELAGIWGSTYKDIAMADTISAETNINKATEKLIRGGYTDDGTTLNARGQALLNDWKNTTGWTEETQKNIEAQSEATTVKLGNGQFVFTEDGGGKFNANLKSGNFSIKGPDGTIYRMETGEKVTDDTIKQAASSVPNRTAFIYNSRIYYKNAGSIYAINSRSGGTGGKDYQDLYEAIEGV